MEKDAKEAEEMEKQQGKAKAAEAKRKIEEAHNRQERPVEESEVVEEMFGFLGDKELDRNTKA